MNRRLLIGVIAIMIAGVGLVIAGVIVRPAFITLGIGVVLVGAWLYMLWMVRKKKTSLFGEQMEPGKAERRYKILKVSVLAAGILLLLGIIGTVMHNALYAVNEIEEPVFFTVAIVGLFGFVIATAGGWIFYFIGRKAA